MRSLIKTGEIRVKDLKPGDVLSYKDRPSSRVAVWRQVSEVNPMRESLNDPGRFVVKFTEGTGKAYGGNDLVTIQVPSGEAPDPVGVS